MSRVCVAGAGPAGLAAAIFAARAGADVILIEKNRQCGVKLLTTGGGHCNITNIRPAEEWPALFGKRGRFITPALERMPRSRLEEWLETLGEPLHCPDGRHVFPCSNSARAVRDALVAEVVRLGVRIVYSQRILEVLIGEDTKTGVPGNSVTALCTEAGQFACNRVVLALGGKSYPATGSTWEGAAIAKAMGHRVNSPHPGLVGLVAENLDAELAGLVLPDALISARFKGEGVVWGRGELLLTHGGISGPAVLDVSGRIAEALDALASRDKGKGQTVTVKIAWNASDASVVSSPAVWRERLAGWKKIDGAALPATHLKEFFPLRLARWLCAQSGIDANTPMARLTSGNLERFAEFAGGYPAHIVGTQGWDKAMITRGGVDVREIDPHTMESKKIPGLFFAGEMIDMDGPCGGYNIHWAFASGALAGESAASIIPAAEPVVTMR